MLCFRLLPIVLICLACATKPQSTSTDDLRWLKVKAVSKDTIDLFNPLGNIVRFYSLLGDSALLYHVDKYGYTLQKIDDSASFHFIPTDAHRSLLTGQIAYGNSDSVFILYPDKYANKTLSNIWEIHSFHANSSHRLSPKDMNKGKLMDIRASDVLYKTETIVLPVRNDHGWFQDCQEDCVDLYVYNLKRDSAYFVDFEEPAYDKHFPKVYSYSPMDINEREGLVYYAYAVSADLYTYNLQTGEKNIFKNNYKGLLNTKDFHLRISEGIDDNNKNPNDDLFSPRTVGILVDEQTSRFIMTFFPGADTAYRDKFAYLKRRPLVHQLRTAQNECLGEFVLPKGYFPVKMEGDTLYALLTIRPSKTQVVLSKFLLPKEISEGLSLDSLRKMVDSQIEYVWKSSEATNKMEDLFIRDGATLFVPTTAVCEGCYNYTIDFLAKNNTWLQEQNFRLVFVTEKKTEALTRQYPWLDGYDYKTIPPDVFRIHYSFEAGHYIVLQFQGIKDNAYVILEADNITDLKKYLER